MYLPETTLEARRKQREQNISGNINNPKLSLLILRCEVLWLWSKNNCIPINLCHHVMRECYFYK